MKVQIFQGIAVENADISTANKEEVNKLDTDIVVEELGTVRANVKKGDKLDRYNR